MKKERKFILTIFGIMFMALGISVACTVADKDNVDTSPVNFEDTDALLKQTTVDLTGAQHYQRLIDTDVRKAAYNLYFLDTAYVQTFNISNIEGITTNTLKMLLVVDFTVSNLLITDVKTPQGVSVASLNGYSQLYDATNTLYTRSDNDEPYTERTSLGRELVFVKRDDVGYYNINAYKHIPVNGPTYYSWSAAQEGYTEPSDDMAIFYTKK